MNRYKAKHEPQKPSLHIFNFLAGERNSSGHCDQICNACLLGGVDPHSVSSEDLAASLGCMVQLPNLVVHNLAAPALPNSGFAGCCSRILQRDSFGNARPSSRSNENPLFIPRQNYCSASAENSWTDRSSSNFGVASMVSERSPLLDSPRSSTFNYSSMSPHSVETHKDLQKGISLLKKSVACCNLLCLDVPSDASTFEAFAKLLATLSSSKEVGSFFNLRMACSRSCKQGQKLNNLYGMKTLPFHQVHCWRVHKHASDRLSLTLCL